MTADAPTTMGPEAALVTARIASLTRQGGLRPLWSGEYEGLPYDWVIAEEDRPKAEGPPSGGTPRHRGSRRPRAPPSPPVTTRPRCEEYGPTMPVGWAQRLATLLR
jgi:hypothetical protein